MLTENRFSLEGRLFHSTEVIFHLPKLNEKYISVREYLALLQIEQKFVKNPNWWKANQLTIY